MLLTIEECSRMGGVIEGLREIYNTLDSLFGETETVQLMRVYVATLTSLYRKTEIINEKEP